MELKTAVALLISILLVILAVLPVQGTQGPRNCPGLVVRFYANVESAYAALAACDADMIGYELTSELYISATEDPNICLGPVGDQGKYEIDINNNCTIPDYEGIESPTYGKKRKSFRQALTCLMDKNRVIDECCGGFADRIDQPIAYMHRGWRNTSCWYEDGTYPYEYNVAQAIAYLEADGFLQGYDENPCWDPGDPLSAQFLRVYPPEGGPWAPHPQLPGQTLDPLKFCIRTDDLRRTCAGDLLADAMCRVGIPVNRVYGPSSALYPIVMDALNYHLYTGGWNLGRFPPLYLYGLYHCSQFFLGGSNYVTGCMCPWDQEEPCPPPEEDPAWCDEHCCNYPELDRYLELARYPATLADAQNQTKNALGYIACQQCITIELFSARSFWAWKCDVKGVVVGEGTGLENGYNFMNAYKTDGSPLVYALITPPNEQNIIFSSWYYDYQVLDRWNDGGGISTAPYDLSIDQTGGCLQWWEVGEWAGEFPCHETVEGTLVTQIYRNNSWFQMPITGEPIQNAREDCIYKSLMYYAQHSTAWIYSSVQDIHTARMIQGTDGCPGIELYFDTTGYWNTYYGTTYWLADQWFLGQTNPLAHEMLIEDVTADEHGHLNLPCPVFWVESITDNVTGAPIPHWDGTTVGFDGWRIQKKNPSHDVWWNMDVNVGVPNAGRSFDLLVWCTATTEQIAGYWPGDNEWFNVAIGCGPYYLIDYVPGAGGWAILECCPFYQLETPVLGEVDFVRKPNGCYRVDIFDVVMAASAYGSQGGGVPDDNWFPGADLAPECCRIDIFDIVTITSVYGVEHDCCPCPDYPP